MGTYKYISKGSSPLTLEAAKLNLRIVHALEDTNIQSKVDAATDYAERTLGFDLSSNVIQEVFNEFPGIDELLLSKWPIISVTSISYIDTNGDTQVFDSANYAFDEYMPKVPLIYLVDGAEWPTDVSTTERYPVIVEYTAGSVTAPASVIEALQLITARLFERREDEVLAIPRSVTQFLAKYKEYTF